ncbi:hypothetical protein GCM10020255_084840 [Rhodococcus baikonurensis]
MLAKHGAAAETDAFCDDVDGEIRILQELLGGQYPLITEPSGGVVPVSAWKRRANVRADMFARAATIPTVRSRARFSVIQSRSGARVALGVEVRGVATYWACPPSRWGGTTILLAMPLATREPCSFRTMCRHKSIPAAVPALVNTGSSST